MLNQPQNPYFNMAMMRSSEMFFGRSQLIRKFYEAVARRQSVSLLGPYHIGKSSFLWCTTLPEVQALFPLDLRHHIFVFIDLRKYLKRTSGDFFHHVSREIVVQGAKVGLALQSEGQGEDEFSSVLDQIAEQGFFPVLLLDTFDNITRNEDFGSEFLSFLRSQASVGLVSYVTASVAPLAEFCHKNIKDSPFFNIFYPYTLEALTREEALDLIKLPAERVGRPFTDTEIALVLKLAGRHPFFIQRVCYVLYDDKLQQREGEIDEQRLKNLAYKDLKEHFQSTWNALSDIEKGFLLDESQRKVNQRRLLTELSESALFRYFVRRTCQMKLFSMTAKDLKEALDNMHNLSMLGETNLRLLKTVSQRLLQNTSPLAVEKGAAIRDVLSEALEHLRGSGPYAKTDLEWKFYNILLFSYFKPHLKNDYIVAQLQLSSLRQFYRERDTAIELLLTILLDMEHAAYTREYATNLFE